MKTDSCVAGNHGMVVGGDDQPRSPTLFRRDGINSIPQIQFVVCDAPTESTSALFISGAPASTSRAKNQRGEEHHSKVE